MPLTEEAFTAASGRKYGCRIDKTLRALSPKERAVVEKVLTDKLADGTYRVSNAAVAKVLTDNGHKISSARVSAHRRDHVVGCPS